MYPARSFSLFAPQVKVADELAGAFSIKLTIAVFVTPPLITVIVAGLFPGLALAVFMLAVITPFFGPDVGLSDSQEALSLAVHDSVELSVMVWAGGFGAP